MNKTKIKYIIESFQKMDLEFVLTNNFSTTENQTQLKITL